MKKIGFLLICIITTTLVLTNTSIGQNQYFNDNHLNTIQSTKFDFLYSNNFDTGLDDWDTGSEEGPDLWHITDFDSWDGDNAFACFDSGFKTYVNDMYFNWALAPVVINVENEFEIIMDFYFKYITENINDNWGVCIYDPISEIFVPFTYAELPYDTYGYHPDWTGPMQPMSEYVSFDVLDAYSHGYYDLGLFRDTHGNPAYDLRVGFMFFESDGSGFINAEAEANDIYWSGLMIDDVIIKHLVFNQAPLTPYTPSGSTSLKSGISYEYSTSTTDPDNDNIRYGWDWNNDDIVDYVTGYVASGETITTSHIFTTVGTYDIRVKAEDDEGASSDFSEPLSVTVSENQPPNKPTITGETNGKVGNEYEYTISSVDPDGDDVYFEIEWYDGCPGVLWEGPYSSGSQVIKNNTWTERGEYTITVRVKDYYGLEGESSTLIVSMPQNQFKDIFYHGYLLQLIKLFNQIWNN